MFPHQAFIFMNQHKTTTTKLCVNKITRMPAAATTKKKHYEPHECEILCLKGNLIDIFTFIQRKTQ